MPPPLHSSFRPPNRHSGPPIVHSGESRNPGGGRGGRGGTNHTKSLPPTGASIFIPRCAGDGRHKRLVRKACPGLRSGMNSGTGRLHQPRSRETPAAEGRKRDVALGLVPSHGRATSRPALAHFWGIWPSLFSSLRRSRACPVPRYGAGIQKGRGKTAIQ